MVGEVYNDVERGVRFGFGGGSCGGVFWGVVSWLGVGGGGVGVVGNEGF